MVAGWAQAAFWGLVAGSGLLLGAVAAYFWELPHRVIATIMAFGGGVLISVLSLRLVAEAYAQSGIGPTLTGFIGGAALFSTVNWLLSKRGARNRKRCGECVQQPSEAEVKGSGLAIAIGALMDGIPESLVLGLGTLTGMAIGGGVLAGFFLSNIPQGLSSAAGMKAAGRSARYIFGVWSGIMVASGIAAFAGYTIFSRLAPEGVGASTALAAGGLLAMLAETMIPEAFEKAQSFIGLITVTGFLAALAIMGFGA